MELEMILALGAAGSGLLVGGGVLGKTLWTRFKALSADNAKLSSLQGLKDTFADLGIIWSEHSKDIQEFVGQAMALSKAVSTNTRAVTEINTNAQLREAIVKAAAGFGPNALDALSAALTPVPAGIRDLAGMDTDKLKKLVAAQQEELSKKEATNKVLENSGKMAASIAKAVASVAPLILSGK